MKPVKNVELLETLELILLVAGSVAIIGIIVELTRRRQWRAAGALPPVPLHRLDPADLLMALLAMWMLPSFVPALARTISAALSGQEPSSMPATEAAAEVLPAAAQLLGRTAAALAVLWLGLRSYGSAAAWGLRPLHAGRNLLIAVASFVAVWPLCAGALFLTRGIAALFIPGYEAEDHTAIQTLAANVSPWIRGMTAFGAVVVAPIAEELFFRGMLQPALAQWSRSTWAGILLAALLFGLLHLSVPDTVPPLTLFGIALGFVAVKSGSLVAPILLHMVFNARTVAGIWLGHS